MIIKKNILAFLDIVLTSLNSGIDEDAIREAFLADISNKTGDAATFIGSLARIKKELASDLDFFMQSDPAANSAGLRGILGPGRL